MHAFQYRIIRIAQTGRHIRIGTEMNEFISCLGGNGKRQIPVFYRTDGKTAVFVRLLVGVSTPSPMVKQREIEIISGC